MGNYNPIYKSIWQSQRFTKLQPNEKLVYLNLLTNKQVSQSGIYNIMPQYIACDCGLDTKEVINILEKLDKLQMIKFYKDENLIFIHKYFKYTRGMIKNPSILSKALNRERELIDNKEVWQLFDMEFYYELELINEALIKNQSNKNKNDNDNNVSN